MRTRDILTVGGVAAVTAFLSACFEIMADDYTKAATDVWHEEMVPDINPIDLVSPEAKISLVDSWIADTKEMLSKIDALQAKFGTGEDIPGAPWHTSDDLAKLQHDENKLRKYLAVLQYLHDHPDELAKLSDEKLKSIYNVLAHYQRDAGDRAYSIAVGGRSELLHQTKAK